VTLPVASRFQLSDCAAAVLAFVHASILPPAHWEAAIANADQQRTLGGCSDIVRYNYLTLAAFLFFRPNKSAGTLAIVHKVIFVPPHGKEKFDIAAKM
jgi:hypothetical protein